MRHLREAVFVRQSGVEARLLPDGSVLVDVQSGRVFELNKIGSEIWALLDGVRSLETLCEAVATRYEVAREVVETDLDQLVADLVQARLIDRLPVP